MKPFEGHAERQHPYGVLLGPTGSSRFAVKMPDQFIELLEQRETLFKLSQIKRLEKEETDMPKVVRPTLAQFKQSI